MTQPGRSHGLSAFLHNSYEDWRNLGFLGRERHPEAPTEMLDSIDRYVVHGVRPGSFIEAVLHNDLIDACASADIFNRYKLVEIVGYVYTEIPSGLHSNPQSIRSWIEDHEQLRQQRQQQQS